MIKYFHFPFKQAQSGITIFEKRIWLPVKWITKKIRRYWVCQREKMWVLDRELPSVIERRSIPSPLYKALKSGPHGSVHGPPLLPHWNLQTVSQCPTHLPSIWSKETLRFVFLYCRDIDSALPGCHASPDRQKQSDGITLLHRLPLIFLGKGSKCQSPRRKVGM